jgi:hypothetical protein
MISYLLLGRVKFCYRRVCGDSDPAFEIAFTGLPSLPYIKGKYEAPNVRLGPQAEIVSAFCCKSGPIC